MQFRFKPPILNPGTLQVLVGLTTGLFSNCVQATPDGTLGLQTVLAPDHTILMVESAWEASATTFPPIVELLACVEREVLAQGPIYLFPKQLRISLSNLSPNGVCPEEQIQLSILYAYPPNQIHQWTTQLVRRTLHGFWLNRIPTEQIHQLFASPSRPTPHRRQLLYLPIPPIGIQNVEIQTPAGNELLSLFHRQEQTAWPVYLPGLPYPASALTRHISDPTISTFQLPPAVTFVPGSEESVSTIRIVHPTTHFGITSHHQAKPIAIESSQIRSLRMTIPEPTEDDSWTQSFLGRSMARRVYGNAGGLPEILDLSAPQTREQGPDPLPVVRLEIPGNTRPPPIAAFRKIRASIFKRAQEVDFRLNLRSTVHGTHPFEMVRGAHSEVSPLDQLAPSSASPVELRPLCLTGELFLFASEDLQPNIRATWQQLATQLGLHFQSRSITEDPFAFCQDSSLKNILIVILETSQVTITDSPLRPFWRIRREQLMNALDRAGVSVLIVGPAANDFLTHFLMRTSDEVTIPILDLHHLLHAPPDATARLDHSAANGGAWRQNAYRCKLRAQKCFAALPPTQAENRARRHYRPWFEAAHPERNYTYEFDSTHESARHGASPVLTMRREPDHQTLRLVAYDSDPEHFEPAERNQKIQAVIYALPFSSKVALFQQLAQRESEHQTLSPALIYVSEGILDELAYEISVFHKLRDNELLPRRSDFGAYVASRLKYLHQLQQNWGDNRSWTHGRMRTWFLCWISQIELLAFVQAPSALNAGALRSMQSQQRSGSAGLSCTQANFRSFLPKG